MHQTHCEALPPVSTAVLQCLAQPVYLVLALSDYITVRHEDQLNQRGT
jgi:hypothetical protein